LIGVSFRARIDTLSRTYKKAQDMSDEWATVIEAVRDRVEPDVAEREAMQTAIGTLTDRVKDAIADLPVDAEVQLAGSTARDTWLAGDRDIDIFVAFSPDIARDELESYGLTVGHAVLPDGREEFAEHPYVVGEHDGFAVDIVPCYAVKDATAIQSAVDRTPFHTAYIRDRITPELASDIRVCKQFLTGIGIYGSDLHTQGFSGYLTELLVVEYGGFRPLVEAAADWHPPVELDPESHGTVSFDDSLTVIDPTDPERNVAAVLSAENLARFQHYARDLLSVPRVELFAYPEPEPLTESAVRAGFTSRGTTPIAIMFETPAIVDDQLWPQLERSRSGVADELDRRGFSVFRSAAFVSEPEESETSALLFELSAAELPALERHAGPPVHVREHAESFYEAYVDDEETVGPFVDGDRYVVERPREFASAAAFLTSDALFDVGLGAHVETMLDSEYEVLVGEAVGSLAAEFGAQLAQYLSPTPRNETGLSE